MGDTQQAPIPGWYEDPDNPALIQYWDGNDWTGHQAEPAPLAAPAVTPATAVATSTLPPPVAPAQPASPFSSPDESGAAPAASQLAPVKKKSRFSRGNIIVTALVAIAVIAGAFFGIRALTGGSSTPAPAQTQAPIQVPAQSGSINPGGQNPGFVVPTGP